MSLTDELQQLQQLLYDAIPKDRLEWLKTIPEGTKVNGGTSRGTYGIGNAICSYNNTIKDEAEIIQWYENAKALAQARGI